MENKSVVIKPMPKNKPSVANVGIKIFYDSLAAQGAKCIQIEWIPPFKPADDIQQLLKEFL